jgi:hypothetical protein
MSSQPPEGLGTRPRTVWWVILNLAAATVATFALTDVIDAQIASGDVEIEEGFEGLARATALALLLFGTVVTYLVLRVGAVLIGRTLTVSGGSPSVTLAPVAARSVDLGNLVITVLAALGLPHLLPDAARPCLLTAVVIVIVGVLWVRQSGLHDAPSRGRLVLHVSAVAIPVVAVGLSHLGRW